MVSSEEEGGGTCHNDKPGRSRDKNLKMEIQKGGDAGRVKSDLGGTCHNDNPGLNDGDDGGVGMRMRGAEAGWKAGPATMTSRAMCMRK